MATMQRSADESPVRFKEVHDRRRGSKVRESGPNRGAGSAPLVSGSPHCRAENGCRDCRATTSSPPRRPGRRRSRTTLRSTCSRRTCRRSTLTLCRSAPAMRSWRFRRGPSRINCSGRRAPLPQGAARRRTRTVCDAVRSAFPVLDENSTEANRTEQHSACDVVAAVVPCTASRSVHTCCHTVA